MRLGADKTDAISFEAGFCFLGEDFGTRYPPVIGDRIEFPDERTVFVAAAGSRVRIDQGRVVVERDEEELLDAPAGLVARIVCFGPVGVSAGLRNWALSSGVELVFCSQRGRYLGQVVSGHVNRVERLCNQFAAADAPDRFLPLARGLVEAKVRKQAVLLRRMRKDTAGELAESVKMFTRAVRADCRAGVPGRRRPRHARRQGSRCLQWPIRAGHGRSGRGGFPAR